MSLFSNYNLANNFMSTEQFFYANTLGNGFGNGFGGYSMTSGGAAGLALTSVFGQMLNTTILPEIFPKKEAPVDYGAKLNSVNSQIKAQYNSKIKLDTANTGAGAKIDNYKDIINEINNHNTKKNDLKKEIDNLKAKDPKDEVDKAQLANLEKVLASEEKILKDLGSKESLEAKIEKQQKLIDANNDQIKKIQAKIKELEIQRADYETLLNRQEALAESKQIVKDNKDEFNEADGTRSSRADKSCLDKEYSKDNNPASQEELQTGIRAFVKAKSLSQKRTYAKIVIQMYESNSDLQDVRGTVATIKSWLEKYPEEKED